MKHLFIDFETASELDLSVVGIDRYANHSSTRPLMLSYAIDNDAVQLWEPHKETIPKKLLQYLLDPAITKAAWNATFERYILKYCLKIDIPWNQFMDIMVWARHLSLPGGLGDCGTVLGLPDDSAKIEDGTRLKNWFCQPYTMGGKITLFGVSPPEFHDYDTHPVDWKLFCDYCIRDTEVERTIFKVISDISPLPDREQKLWELDQRINERGIPTDRQFVQNAYDMAVRCKDALVLELKQKTGLNNPNSRPQLLPWLQQHGYTYKSLKKEFVASAIAKGKLPKEVSDVLTLRQSASKTSYTKLETLVNILSDDDRLRGQFMFLGASRSGRWSGSGVQVHNLPRPIKWIEKNLDLAMSLVSVSDYAVLTDILSKEKNPPTVISVMTSIIRSCFQSSKGKKLSVCDLNAIENRVLGWVAGCDAIMKVFRDGLCPYLSFACKMYNIDYPSLNAAYQSGDPEAKNKRQVAKAPVLGAGYGLGAGVNRFCTLCGHELKFHEEYCPEHYDDLIQYEAKIVEDKCGNKIKTGLMGYAENMGVSLTPEQAYTAWKIFRESYPEVVTGWSDLENAAIEVMKYGGEVQVGPVVFDRKEREGGGFVLRIKLPSGRYLHYMNTVLRLEKKISARGKEYTQTKIMYDGIGHGVGMITTGWGQVYTYGGKLMENVVQAISRDLLADAMMMAEELGAEIVLHVHDEIVTEADAQDPFAFGLKDLQHCMSTTPDWAPGLPLHADGFEGQYYKK